MTLFDILCLALEAQTSYKGTGNWERDFNCQLLLLLGGGKDQLSLDVFLEYLEITQGDIIDTLQCNVDDPYYGNTVAGDDGFTHPPDEKA